MLNALRVGGYFVFISPFCYNTLMSNWVIVGLGNPGGEYEGSRHNAGRSAVMHFAKKHGADEWKENKKAKAQVTKVELEGGKATLVLPDTFMNKSGSAVVQFVKSVKAAANTVIVYDDLDLPLGKIKMSFGRGSGGHKGVESIMRALKTKDFVRIRIGVSKKTAKGVAKKVHGDEEVIEYVLSAFRKPELEELQKVFKKIDEALTLTITLGREKAMNVANQ